MSLATSTISALSCVTQKIMKNKQHMLHLTWLIDNADWKESNNFLVEDSVLKLILGTDASLFNVDVLQKH